MRLNCIAHLLGQFDHHEVERPTIEPQQRLRHPDYSRAPERQDMFVPERY